MGRAKLPEARIEPRGVEGHLARLRAEAREGTRVAGAIGLRVARILGWTAFAGGTLAMLVWLAPPRRNPQLDEIRRIQADFQRQQLNMEATRRALEVWQSQNNVRLSQDLQRVPSTSTPNARAAKEAHAAQRAQAIEVKRAQRTR
jgi:hypothetical protein